MISWCLRQPLLIPKETAVHINRRMKTMHHMKLSHVNEQHVTLHSCSGGPKERKCSKRKPLIRKCKQANMYIDGGWNNVSAHQRAKKHSLTQQQALTLGLQCSGAAKQPRHQRDSMNALLQCVKWSWEAGREGGREGEGRLGWLPN